MDIINEKKIKKKYYKNLIRIKKLRLTSQGDGARDMGEITEIKVGDELCSMFDIFQDTISENHIDRIQC